MKRVLLIVLALLIYALITAPVGAGELQGVKTTVWDVNGQNNAPALTDGQEPVCTVTLPDISHNFDRDPLCGLYEDFIVHFEGWITFPQSGTVRLQAQADDGTRVLLDGRPLIDDWVDKGGGGLVSEPFQVTAGQSQHIDVWYYENGGGAWIELWSNFNDTWTIVNPDSLTQQQPLPPEPTPTPTPSETTPTPSPTPSPTIEPPVTETPSPTTAPTKTASATPTPSPTQTQAMPVESPTPPATSGNVTPSYPTASASPTIISPTTPSIPTPIAMAQQPTIESPGTVAQPTATNEPSKASTNRKGIRFRIHIPDITQIGNDMTPAQRKESQQVVIGSIIVGQIARRIRR